MFLVRAYFISLRCSITLTSEWAQVKPLNCWIPCGATGGKCNTCGRNAYCCRQGFYDCPLKSWQAASSDYHSCVGFEDKDLVDTESLGSDFKIKN